MKEIGKAFEAELASVASKKGSMQKIEGVFEQIDKKLR